MSLEIRGLDAFVRELQQLPDDLKGEATGIVLEAATAATNEIRAAYPQGPTGNLKKDVRMTVQAIGPHGVSAEVRSAAYHAWLWEHGSQARHYVTKNGVPHNTGSMPAPPQPVFIPTMIRTRRRMYAQLAALLQRQGLTVTER